MVELRRIFDDLVDAEITLWSAVESRLQADFELTAGRFQAMRAIAATPDCRVFDIAAELHITVGAASKVIDRVEAAGHCVRLPNPSDRRSSLIELTPTGADCLTRATTVFDAELRVRFGVLSSPELRQLAAALAKIRS